MTMQRNSLGFVRKSRVEDLADLKPTDDRFLAVQLSEDSVFPPTAEAVREIAELRREAFTCYNEAANEQGFAVAQQLIDDVSAKKRAIDSQQACFDEVVYCYSAAESAEQMELSARNPQMTVAGQWKLIRLHTQKRLVEYNKQKATAAAAARAAEAGASWASREWHLICPLRIFVRWGTFLSVEATFCPLRHLFGTFFSKVI